MRHDHNALGRDAVSHVNKDGVQFRAGDEVAALPDNPAALKLRGKVISVQRGRWHVAVDFEDYAIVEAHIDRIALVGRKA